MELFTRETIEKCKIDPCEKNTINILKKCMK